jgi:Malectin domain
MIGTNNFCCGPIKVGKVFPWLVKVGIGMVWIISLFKMVEAQSKFEPIRINCGGSRFVDPVTNFLWINDSTKYVTKGTQVSRCNDRFLTIANTTKSMREVYCSNRSFKTSVALESNQYVIPVLNTNASYIVRLHFAELVSHENFLFHGACAYQQKY